MCPAFGVTVQASLYSNFNGLASTKLFSAGILYHIFISAKTIQTITGELKHDEYNCLVSDHITQAFSVYSEHSLLHQV